MDAIILVIQTIIGCYILVYNQVVLVVSTPFEASVMAQLKNPNITQEPSSYG